MTAKHEISAPTGRSKTASGKVALVRESQNMSSPEGTKEGDNIRSVLNDGKHRSLWPLPATWRWSTVGQLTEVIRGASPRPKGDPRYFGGNVPWIMIADVTRQPGKYLYKTREGVTEAGAALSRKISAGELILSNSATVCVPKILKVDGCIHDGFVAFPTLKERVNLDFAYYWFEFVRPTMIQENRQGVTQVNMNTGIVREMHFPFAPLPEQGRIVAEIEKHFTRLEAGVAALKRVQANLKRYRASVLKAACEGRFVPTEAELARSRSKTKKSEPAYETGEALLARILADRRKNWNGRGKYKEPAPSDTTNLPVLPDGWTWATAQQLNLANRPCAYGVLQPGEHVADGVPLVRVGDINNGKVDITNLKRISTKIAAQYPRTKLSGGELAITLVGAIGRTAIIPESLAGGNTARAVGIIPLTKQVNAHWVEVWFRNPAKNAEMDSKSHEVARKTLNLEDVRVASVALPPLDEQTRIVAEVERRLSVVDELEAVVSANLQRATRLRQSILQKAFTGELV